MKSPRVQKPGQKRGGLRITNSRADVAFRSGPSFKLSTTFEIQVRMSRCSLPNTMTTHMTRDKRDTLLVQSSETLQWLGIRIALLCKGCFLVRGIPFAPREITHAQRIREKQKLWRKLVISSSICKTHATSSC